MIVQAQTKHIAQKILTVVSFIFLIALMFGPTLTHAAQDTGVNSGITYYCTDGNCTFDDFIAAIRKAVNWGIGFGLAFSVVVIAVAGYTYMTSGGSASERKKANDMLLKVAKGIAFMLAAWLIVNLIMTTLAPHVTNYIQN